MGPVPDRFFQGDVKDLYAEEDEQLTLLNYRICELPDFSTVEGNVTHVNLRQNFLTHIKGLEYFTNLTKIDLYLNTIEDIPDFSMFPQLVWLDLSFNCIRKLKNLESAPGLKEIFFVHNKIKKIENV